MRYSQLGEFKNVSVICMGTDVMGSRRPVELSHQLLDMYYDMGGNFIDTARVYGQTPEGISRSERCVGEWLKSRGRRDSVVLATKGAHYSLKDRSSRLGRADIISDCEASLRDLQVDYIDLYWLHRDDENRTVDEIIDTLDELKKRGWVRAFGCSNWYPERIRQANEYAACTGKPGFIADEPQYSLARQVIPGDPTLVQMDDKLYAYHAETKMPAVPYSSQAKGFYSKLDSMGEAALELPTLKPYDDPRNNARLPILREIAASHGVPVSAVALGYLMGQSFLVFPIVGMSKPEYAEEVRAAGELVLSADEVEMLR